ncbi:MAG TPA: hypothetical protein VNX68_04125 [Nitrosopumilaceae archaeon]|jgi:hypothetical protein|nr:hypothetical protein [Nitrosopumilaceae archaeon]
MSIYEALSLLVETYIAGILTAEYFFGRSDTDMKSEARRKRKFRDKYRFESLTNGEMR